MLKRQNYAPFKCFFFFYLFNTFRLWDSFYDFVFFSTVKKFNLKEVTLGRFTPDSFEILIC